MKKVILDKSIFHGDKFARIKKSNLLELCNTRSLLILGNPILIEETLNLYNKNSNLFRNHISLILSIINDKWFRQLPEIIADELEGKINSKLDIYESSEEVCDIKINIYKSLIMDNLDIYQKVAVKMVLDFKKYHYNRMREMLSSIRRDIIAILRSKTINGKKFPDYNEYCLLHLEDQAWQLISKKIASRLDKAAIFESWKRAPLKFPYFTLWAKAMLYLPYHAAVKHNTSIDKNAQSDIDEIVYMNDADILVSDDMRFMRDIFQEFWGGRKTIYSLDDFLGRINKQPLVL